MPKKKTEGFKIGDKIQMADGDRGVIVAYEIGLDSGKKAYCCHNDLEKLNEQKFQIADRVKSIHHVSHGIVNEIMEIRYPGTNPFCYRVKFDTGELTWQDGGWLTILENETKFKIGDQVKLKDYHLGGIIESIEEGRAQPYTIKTNFETFYANDSQLEPNRVKE